MDNKKIYMIGNSHIDPVWLWRSGEGFQEVKSTFASALDRMNEFPEFVFNASSVIFYKWIEENLPEMFEEIVKRVKEGRWNIVGGWWIEPDCNIPSGESFVRQGLYSQRYLKEKFGRIASVGYNVDSFGHNGMLPQILKKSGLSSYAVMRPHSACLELPSPLFKWRAKDGSEVTGCRLEGEYTAWTKVGVEKNLESTLKSMEEKNLDKMVCFYGVGNHGGGPTIDNIKSIREIDDERPDLDIKCSSLEEFFKDLEGKEMPVYDKELQRIFPGCFSVDSEIKKFNRASENLALKSERLAALGALIGKRKYPAEAIESMWELILFNQFHDILAGTSREEGRNDAIEEFKGALTLGRRILNNSVQAIANSIDTRGEGFPLILFNPNSYDIEEVVTTDVYWQVRKPLRLKSPDGEEVLYQETKHELIAKDSRRRIVFKAKVPAMGYAVYRMLQEKVTVEGSMMKIENYVLENNLIKATFDETTGKIKSIIDKSTGYEALKGDVAFKVYKDERDTWGAEGKAEELLGEFKLVQIKVEEEGENRSILRVMFEHGKSTLLQYYYLYKDADYIEVKNRLFNLEKNRLINLSIPVNVERPVFRGEIPYGFEDRAFYNGEEYFAHSYARIFEESTGQGIIVANDSKYGYRMFGNNYELILSRSSVFARGSGDVINEDKENRYTDQGELEFNYIIKAHGKAVNNFDAIKLASKINLSYEYLADNLHRGDISLRSKGFISVSKENIIVNVVKRSEDDESFIVRLYETEGLNTECLLSFLGKQCELSFGPCEIKTIKINIGTNNIRIKEVNLLEL